MRIYIESMCVRLLRITKQHGSLQRFGRRTAQCVRAPHVRLSRSSCASLRFDSVCVCRKRKLWVESTHANTHKTYIHPTRILIRGFTHQFWDKKVCAYLAGIYTGLCVVRPQSVQKYSHLAGVLWGHRTPWTNPPAPRPQITHHLHIRVVPFECASPSQTLHKHRETERESERERDSVNEDIWLLLVIVCVVVLMCVDMVCLWLMVMENVYSGFRVVVSGHF